MEVSNIKAYPPQMEQNGQQMYQASDGKWYPVTMMPQGYNQGGPPQGGYDRGYYGQQQPMGWGQQQQQPQNGGWGPQPYGQQPYGGQYGQQPIMVQDRYGGQGGAGMGGAGCLAALCGALLCFDLGACLF